MTIIEAIVARKAVRRYTNDILKDDIIDDIKKYIKTIKPLTRGINCHIDLIKRGEYEKRFNTAFVPVCPDYIIISSEEAEGYRQNAGFMGEQLVLFITSLGLGTCWLSSANPKKSERGANKLSHVITIAFGRADGGLRMTGEIPKRVHLHEMVLAPINDPKILPMIDAARFAPSCMNMQPIRVMPCGNEIHVYRKKPVFNLSFLNKYQSIDAGISLANMFTAGNGEYDIRKKTNYPDAPAGFLYEGTIAEKKDKAK